MISSSMGAGMPVILKFSEFTCTNHAMRSSFMGAILHGSDCEHVMFVSPYLFKCAQVTSSVLKLQKRFDVLYLNLCSCFCSMISSSMGAVMPAILKVLEFTCRNHAMRSPFMGAIVNMRCLFHHIYSSVCESHHQYPNYKNGLMFCT